MKKVGIITFHRANNFGAVLQCYALQETLIKLGFEAKVIDYREPFTELIYSPFRLDIIKKGITHPRLMGGYIFKAFPKLYKRAKQYNTFRNKFLKTTPPVKKGKRLPQDFDIYLIGSDQMWSLHPTGNKIEPVYFGEFCIPPNSNIQGYAISSNISSINTIGSDLLLKYVKNFKRISFREKKICKEVELLTGYKGEVVLDPSLLLNFDDWNKLTTTRLIKRRYILTYFLTNESNDPEFKNKVKYFTEKEGLELVDMFDIAYSPISFLNAIKYADCILAASFHAVAFSLLFRKTFYALKTNDGKDIRYINIMEDLGINRLFTIDELPTLEVVPIDYEKVDSKLEVLRVNSINYLRSL